MCCRTLHLHIIIQYPYTFFSHGQFWYHIITHHVSTIFFWKKNAPQTSQVAAAAVAGPGAQLVGSLRRDQRGLRREGMRLGDRTTDDSGQSQCRWKPKAVGKKISFVLKNAFVDRFWDDFLLKQRCHQDLVDENSSILNRTCLIWRWLNLCRGWLQRTVDFQVDFPWSTNSWGEIGCQWTLALKLLQAKLKIPQMMTEDFGKF